ncbi:MAG: MarR family transcriptional regulator [Pseudohongiellaceae bacterium]
MEKPEDRTSGAGKDRSWKLDTMFGYLIRRCHQITVALYLRELEEFDLTPAQFSMLRTVYALGALDQVALAGRLALDMATVGDVARRLDRRGLVTRKTNPNDRRARLVQITPVGEDIIEKMTPAVSRVQEEVLAPLTPEEGQTLISLLQRIANENNELSRAPQRRRKPDAEVKNKSNAKA